VGWGALITGTPGDTDKKKNRIFDIIIFDIFIIIRINTLLPLLTTGKVIRISLERLFFDRISVTARIVDERTSSLIGEPFGKFCFIGIDFYVSLFLLKFKWVYQLFTVIEVGSDQVIYRW